MKFEKEESYCMSKKFIVNSGHFVGHLGIHEVKDALLRTRPTYCINESDACMKFENEESY